MRTGAGQRDQVVTLMRPVATRDTLGQVPTFEPVIQLWARADVLRGREFFAAGQAQRIVEVRFTIPFREDIDESWRVLWRTKHYELTAPPIDVDAARVDLELMCKLAPTR